MLLWITCIKILQIIAKDATGASQENTIFHRLQHHEECSVVMVLVVIHRFVRFGVLGEEAAKQIVRKVSFYPSNNSVCKLLYA